MQLRFLASLMFAIPSILNAQAFSGAAAAAVKTVASLKSTPFKQTLLLKCSNFTQAVRWDNISISLKDDALTLSGTDNLGKNLFFAEKRAVYGRL